VSSAIVIDSHEIQQLWQRKVSPSSRFDVTATKLRRLAKRVKQEWNNFSVEDREALKNLAYSVIKPPKGLFALGSKIRTTVYMVFIVMTNQAEAFYSCMEALDTLIDNILDAAEREEPSYQAVLSDTLEQLYLDNELKCLSCKALQDTDV
jgi:hypothetical protein